MIYVCSDLHGFPLEKFKRMLNEVKFSKNDELFVLGDCIDRGKDGIKILKWMMCQTNVYLILGNHEQLMLGSKFLFEEITDASIANLTGTKLNIYSTWVSNSGRPTIEALQAMRNKEIQYIIEYLEEAPLYECLSVNGKDFILTHSGLGSFNKDKKLSDYTSDDLLWNRAELNQKYYDDKILIFGHTPTVYYGDEYKGRAIVTDSFIDIDVGAGLGLNPMLLRLDDLKEFYFDDEMRIIE